MSVCARGSRCYTPAVCMGAPTTSILISPTLRICRYTTPAFQSRFSSLPRGGSVVSSMPLLLLSSGNGMTLSRGDVYCSRGLLSSFEAGVGGFANVESFIRIA